MALIRFQLDLAIPEEVFKLIPQAEIDTARKVIRQLKSYAVKINEGLPEEEITVRAAWHRCHHDTGDQLCEPEIEI